MVKTAQTEGCTMRSNLASRPKNAAELSGFETVTIARMEADTLAQAARAAGSERVFASGELAAFADNIPDAEMAAAAWRVFLRWVAQDLGLAQVVRPRMVEPTVCMSDPDLFFPEWPDRTDPADPSYGAAADDPAYLHRDDLALVHTALAKRSCTACPIRLMCLDVSVLNHRDHEFGIFGGYGEGARSEVKRLLGLNKRKWRRQSGEDLYSTAARADVLAEAEGLVGAEPGALALAYATSLQDLALASAR